MKLAILHTTPATIDPLKKLAGEILPEVTVNNFLDDSILPTLYANGGNLEEVCGRVMRLAESAKEAGASMILCACSSIGELAALAQAETHLPVVRIDEAMAEEAVRSGAKIGVAATLPTTLGPTNRLLQEKARRANKSVTFEPLLLEEAYRKLLAGDPEGHDQLLQSALGVLAQRVDRVVLAQASMARVVDKLPENVRDKFLSSPRLGMLRVKQTIG